MNSWRPFSAVLVDAFDAGLDAHRLKRRRSKLCNADLERRGPKIVHFVLSERGGENGGVNCERRGIGGQGPRVVTGWL